VLGKLSFETRSLVSVKQVGLHAAVDQGYSTWQQLCCLGLARAQTQLLNGGTGFGQLIAVAQTADSVLADPFLCSWIISHTISLTSIFEKWTANIDKGIRKEKIFHEFMVENLQ
jgi:hypothetical protein